MSELISVLLGLLAFMAMLPIIAAVLICAGGNGSNRNPPPPANYKRPIAPPSPPKVSR
ncbi:Uncharacterised protein [Yersinia frederiksenii]|nr:Uncharacterised protein [Yersinia frederiksenii]